MYLDLSFKKIAAVTLLCIVLYACVSLTFALKDSRYGSTPPFASVSLAWQELSSRVMYGLYGEVWRVEREVRKMLSGASISSTHEAYAIPILTYHRVVVSRNDLNNVTTRNFRDQMLTLKNAGWETITLKQYEAYLRGNVTLPEKSFLLTFDDGAKESFYPVDPVLKALGYNAVIFVIAHAAETAESTYYLSPTEINRMLETGRWEIGSHSYDGHRPYETDSEGGTGVFFADKLWRAEEGRLETAVEFTERVRDDLVHAKQDLESTYNVQINSFAFPLGNETGVAGAANFPEGAAITENEAEKVYEFGFLQTDNGVYSYNYYPVKHSFISYRIHVDYDWDGERLLQKLMQGLPKDLPFQDTFTENRGWVVAWGQLSLGRNNLSLHADPDSSSASAFLDGSALWDNYVIDAAVEWHVGSVSLLADLVDAKTYDSCAFSDGEVRIEHTEAGKTTVSAHKRLSQVTHGENVRIGMRVHGSTIECTWNYTSVIETYNRSQYGGVGVQVWDPQLGVASVQVSEMLVRSHGAPSQKNTVDE